ncbi:MAG: hypothetical protein JO316_13345 [Abitibacteriaceae bacterium]|nr:hypothetical protein [Abditibacteriaceae bacterium]
MLKKFLSLTAAAAILTGLALAEEAKQEVKPTEVHVCPITLEAVKGDGAGTKTVGNYKVWFCCGGCPGAFDKLSKEDKDKKIAAALKKQQDSAKAG